MTSYFITGSSRGLGLELLRQLLPSSETSVIYATCRRVSNDLENLSLSKYGHKLQVFSKIDLRESSKGFTDLSSLSESQSIDVLIHNAGFSSGGKGFSSVSEKDMRESYEVNVIGPLLLTKKLLPCLIRSLASVNQRSKNREPLIVFMSSLLGSIQSTTNGGMIPYRCSKAALNMLSKSLGADLKKESIKVLSLHPGWVKTDMGGKNAPLEPFESIHGILRLIGDSKKYETGHFYDYQGKPIAY